jgi:hypothetical protein
MQIDSIFFASAFFTVRRFIDIAFEQQATNGCIFLKYNLETKFDIW